MLTAETQPDFDRDVDNIRDWYCAQAGPALASRFLGALDRTLTTIASTPQIGVRRQFRHPALQNLRSFRVNPPFDKLLIFYRAEGQRITFVRLMHGARNIRRRLIEPPE